MRVAVCRVLLPMAVIACASVAQAADIEGRYVADEEPGITLALQESADGTINGTLSEPGTSIVLHGRRSGEGFAGIASANGVSLPFSAAIRGERIVMSLGEPGEQERLNFRRGSAAAPVPTAVAAKRSVVINGRRLRDAEVAHAEQAYRIRIPDADYWYDPVLGAWGARGGPAMGFILPGLDLGGPLQADASGGATGVFVNGRELHRYDLAALQQITGPVTPGRYFITAQGLAGREGGPPLWNLAAMAAQAQGGGSNTWQGRVIGASGFSDGTTGAVFLPNGGIVSTGE